MDSDDHHSGHFRTRSYSRSAQSFGLSRRALARAGSFLRRASQGAQLWKAAMEIDGDHSGCS